MIDFEEVERDIERTGLGIILGITVVLIFLLGMAVAAFAHDSWISRGAHRNTAGEWCCGEGDCFVVPPEQIGMDGVGYVLWGVEHVPFSEAQPSPDGAYWRCKRPDNSRRCFFAPPPNT